MQYRDFSRLKHKFLWRIIFITLILTASGSLVYLFFSGSVAKNVAQSLNDSMGLDLSAAANACATFFQTNWMVLGFILILTVFLLFLIYRSVSKGLRQSFRDIDAGIDVLMEGDPLEPISLSPEMFFMEEKLNTLKQILLAREKAAQQAGQRKNRLVNSLAQEIKASLTSLTKDQALFGDESLMSFDQKSNYVGYSQEKFRELDDLLNSFLEFTCNEDAPLSKEVIDVNQMFAQIIGQIQPLLTAQNKDVVLNAEEKSTIFGNQERIYRAFSTILKNAIAYSEVVSAIYVEALVKGYQTRIRITSRGKTIPADVLKVMADKFYGDEDTRAMLDKNGLGLVIAQEILALHDGNLTAESEAGKTTFTINLPLPAEYALLRTGDVRHFQEQDSYAMGNGLISVGDYGQDNFGYPEMGQAPTLPPRPEYGKSEYEQENIFGLRQPGHGDESGAASSEPIHPQGQGKDLAFASRPIEYPQGPQSDKLSLESRMSEYLQDYTETSVPQGSGYNQDHSYRPQDADTLGSHQPKNLQDDGIEPGPRLSEFKQEKEEVHRSPYGGPYERASYEEEYEGYAEAKTGATGATSYEPGYLQLQDSGGLRGHQSGYLQDENAGIGYYQTDYPKSQEKNIGIGVPVFGEHEEPQGLSLYENKYEVEHAKDKGKRKDKDKTKAKQKTKDRPKTDEATGLPLYAERYSLGDSLGGAPRPPEYSEPDSAPGLRHLGDISQMGYSQERSHLGFRQPGYPQTDSGLGSRQPEYLKADSDIGSHQSGYPQADGGVGPRQPGYPQTDGGIGPRQPGYPQADGGVGFRQVGYPQDGSGFGSRQSEEYPPADSGFVSRQPEHLQAERGFRSRQSEYMQADSGVGSRQPEYPQSSSSLGPRQLEYPQAANGLGSRQSEYLRVGSGFESQQPGYLQDNSELIPPRQAEYPRGNLETSTPQGQGQAEQGRTYNDSASRRHERRHGQIDASDGIASYGGLVPYGEIAPYGEVRARSDFYNSMHQGQTPQMGISDTAQTPSVAGGFPYQSPHKPEVDNASGSQGDPYGFLASKEDSQQNRAESWPGGSDSYGTSKYLHKRSYAPDGAYESLTIRRGHDSIHKYTENGRQKM